MVVLPDAGGGVTNTLRVHFPEVQAIHGEVSVAKAFEELTPFGEIARLEVPPSDSSSAVVSYYDVRSAVRALEALMDRCALEPWYGDHAVCLDGEVQLSAEMIPEIAGVHQDEDGGSYTLEFFDMRAAKRALSIFQNAKSPGAVPLLTSKVETLNNPPGWDCKGAGSGLLAGDRVGALGFTSEGLSALMPPCATLTTAACATSGLAGISGLRYRNDLRLSEVSWADLASGRETRTTLRLRCLPARLCDKQSFRTILERARLFHVVDCFRVFPSQGKHSGSALINSSSSAGVAAVAKFFHGRQWGRSMPVAVSFAAVQGAAEIERAFPFEASCLESRRVKHAKTAEPWRVEVCDVGISGASSADEPAGVSEVSTELGDGAEADECRHRGELAARALVG